MDDEPVNGMISERLGNWALDEEVAHNEMGRLFRAHAADEPARVVALKWLTHAKTKSTEFVKLFPAQVDLLRKLKHPAIVAVLDGGAYDGRFCYVMEWIDGSDFQTLLRRGEKPSWSETLSIALRIVPALRYAHRRGVLHRDLKPSNLFRSAAGEYKLSDFGITKFFGDAHLTSADNMLGSVFFISPEQAAGKPHTKRSDFYALGCLLYTLVVGRPPFTGNTVVELIHKHCFVLPERPIHFVPDLPEEFDRFIMKLLAKEPGQRPGSGTLLIQELDGIWGLLERRGTVGKRPPAVVGEDEGDAPPEIDPDLSIRLSRLAAREPIPVMRRWYIVAPLLALCVLALLWGMWWRRPGADDLMAKARPLLQSENPADWDRAWTEYLEPLSRLYPDKYQEEVRQAKTRIQGKGDLQRALAAARLVHDRSPAERFYREGLRLAQAAHWTAAQREWESLVTVYADVEAEQYWVALARDALRRIGEPPGANEIPNSRDNLDEARPLIDEIRRLREAGQTKDADRREAALLYLYRDDPDIEKLRRQLERARE